MKKLLYLLLILPLFMSCSSSDDDAPTQDYTSFTVTILDTPTFSNCVAASKNNSNYIKIADLGDLTKGVYSQEIKLADNSITEIYIFSDYNNGIRFDKTFKLTPNTKNIIEIPYGTQGIRFKDKTDPTQYPQ